MRRHLPVIAILAVATIVRVWGITFGLPHTLTRPDEEAVVSIALHFFSRHFNPGFFDWPSLFMYTVCALWIIYFNIGRLAGWPWFHYEFTFVQLVSLNPAPFHLIARGLSAATGVLTVWIVHRIGAELFDRTTAIIAALFLAIAALHARDSHFGTPDVAATFLLTLSFLYSVKYRRTRSRRDAMLSALWVGLATSTKYNASLVALPGLWLIATNPPIGASGWSPRARLMLAYCGAAAAAFLIGTPYAVLDAHPFAAALAEVGAHLRRGHAAMAGYGWVIHLTSSLRYGLGVPLLTASLAGLALSCWTEPRTGLLLAMFPVVYFAVIGAGQTAFARYIIPIIPFLCLAAAHLVVETAGVLAQSLHREASVKAVAWLLALALALPSAWSTLQIDRLLSRTDNRLVAARWIREEFANGLILGQGGTGYARVQMETPGLQPVSRYQEVPFDEGAGVFRRPDTAEPTPPDAIVIPECPLPVYCDVSDGIGRILTRDYILEKSFRAVDAERPGLAYDRDDAFFVPLAGFANVERPGPNLAIYVRRDLQRREGR